MVQWGRARKSSGQSPRWLCGLAPLKRALPAGLEHVELQPRAGTTTLACTLVPMSESYGGNPSVVPAGAVSGYPLARASRARVVSLSYACRTDVVRSAGGAGSWGGCVGSPLRRPYDGSAPRVGRAGRGPVLDAGGLRHHGPGRSVGAGRYRGG